MHGLVAYDDDSQSDSESPQAQNDKELKIGNKSSTDSRRVQKSQIIIKKLSNLHKSHLRAPPTRETKEERLESAPPHPDTSRGGFDEPHGSSHPEQPEDRIPDRDLTLPQTEDELARIRVILQPPPIPGLVDWGIPPPSSEPCNPSIQAKLAQFSTLKHDPQNPKHFNDSLMSNRSFRNPHLYAKLVEFVDVDERVTNFPRHIWDPEDLQDEWFAERLADQQKFRVDKQNTAQAAGKRSQIAFTSSSSSTLTSQPLGGTKSYGSGSAYGADQGPGRTGQGTTVLGGGKRPSRFQPYGQGQGYSYSGKVREKEKVWHG